MSPEQADRLIGAFERIADALEASASVQLARWEDEHKPKPKPAEATVTVIRTPEEIEREETLGGSETTLEEWVDLGPREKKYNEEYGKEAGEDKEG